LKGIRNETTKIVKREIVIKLVIYDRDNDQTQFINGPDAILRPLPGR
jgi:hypothetical protein